MGPEGQLLMALPTLIPRVRFLKLKSVRGNVASRIGELDRQFLTVVVLIWKSVESIVGFNNRLTA